MGLINFRPLLLHTCTQIHHPYPELEDLVFVVQSYCGVDLPPMKMTLFWNVTLLSWQLEDL